MSTKDFQVGFLIFIYGVLFIIIWYFLMLFFEIESIGFSMKFIGIFFQVVLVFAVPILRKMDVKKIGYFLLICLLIQVSSVVLLGKKKDNNMTPPLVENCLGEIPVDELQRRHKINHSLFRYPGLLEVRTKAFSLDKQRIIEKERAAFAAFLETEKASLTAENCTSEDIKAELLKDYENQINEQMPRLLREQSYCTELSGAINQYLSGQDVEDLQKIFHRYDLPTTGVHFRDSSQTTVFSTNESFFNYLKNSSINQVRSIKIIRREMSRNTETTKTIVFIKK